MRQKRVALHLPDAQTSVVRAPTNRLFRECGSRTERPIIYLVLHHVLQPHVIRRADEYLTLELFSRHSVIQHFISTRVIPQIRQRFAEHPYFGALVHERSAVSISSQHGTRFPHNALDELPDCHARRDCMRVYDHVGSQSVSCEWHVGLRNDHADCPLLSRSRRHLVAQIRNAHLANTHLCDSFAFLALCHKRLVYDTELSFFRRLGRIRLPVARCRRHANKHRLVVDLCALPDHSKLVEFTIIVS